MVNPSLIIQTDFVVVGSGIAGLWSALKLAQRGRVVLVTKKERVESNTNYAQGGLAAVMSPDDSPELHLQDTLKAGAGLCRRSVVEILVNEGPDRVRELMEFGARFTTERTPDGQVRLALGREGGHSRRRIVHAADLTGREVERALTSAVERNPHITLLENCIALDLLMTPEGCAGVLALDRQSRETYAFWAKATVLATGGLGQVYLHTTNPPIATGDGIAMAYRAGALLSNLEFIQFHPTTLYHPSANSFLISEAVRGEGGVLRLADGSPFMEKYHEMGSLAPRDVVARAIHQELQHTGDPCVYLDITHREPDFIRQRFPNIYQKCLSFGIDITQEWIPVVPAAHYSCGGIRTDVYARTNIPRLYAVGEVACTGVHGANRLASNSLIEAVVFAERSVQSLREITDWPPQPEIPAGQKQGPAPGEPSKEQIEEYLHTLRQRMWHQVGIARRDAELQKALEEIRPLYEEVEDLYQHSTPTGRLAEVRNMVTCGLLIIRCALLRKESRGLHYNLDHPDLDPSGPRESVIQGETEWLEPIE